MRHILLAVALVANTAAYAADPVKATGSIEVTNAGGMMGPITSSAGDEPPLDAVKLSITSDG